MLHVYLPPPLFAGMKAKDNVFCRAKWENTPLVFNIFMVNTVWVWSNKEDSEYVSK